MRSSDLHKVCFPVAGRPAINRALDIYKACGIRNHIVVVGHMAGQVIETIGREYEGVIFAYQAEQLGTAHAARQGAKVLDALDEEADVLIVAGDRFVEPQVLEQLFDLFYTRACDLAFIMEPKRKETGLGRIVLSDEGAVLGDVELRDIQQRKIFAEIRDRIQSGSRIDGRQIRGMIEEHFEGEKATRAFGSLWEAVALEEKTPEAEELLKWIPEQKTRFDFRGPDGRPISMTADEVDRTEVLNSSIYLVKLQALRYCLERLDTDNAQREEYLPDMITILAQDPDSRFSVEALKVENPNYVMAFNDPSELLEIESYFQSKKAQEMTGELPSGSSFRTVSEWRTALEAILKEAPGTDRGEEELERELVLIYGEDEALIKERAQAFLETLDITSKRLEESERVLLVRSPGRVNMMGRHVDHQGGHCNLMTIGYETLMAVHPRSDDQVHIYNRDSGRFPNRDFSIGELVAELPWDDWISLVNSDKVSHLVLNAGGDWGQYVTAAVLRLQKKFATQRLRGVDLFVNGNVPIAAGLSSSSALVVATAEAMAAVNRLDTFPSQLVNLCGEGEWFVGTRGGSADHAAIKLGRKGQVVKVTFFEFAVEEIVPFPSDYVLAVCDSGLKAQKTTNAKDQFNHRVACYRIGFQIIKKLFPQYTSVLRHLRDVNTRNLGVPLSWIYKIILRLPERVDRDELRELLPPEDLDPLFETHKPPEDGWYPIRGVVLYGLAECERSRIFAEALKEGRTRDIGRLMSVSHDGDRVCRFNEAGEGTPYEAPTSNGYLLDLIDHLESGDPDLVDMAQLQWQPGSYHCSIPEIDLMVDISTTVDGVAGAQLAGAGLGGCMMVFSHREAVPMLEETLRQRYYEPHGKPAAVMLCKPIAGSGVLLSGGSP
jgi:N-acetylgalactosamine kinase